MACQRSLLGPKICVHKEEIEKYTKVNKSVQLWIRYLFSLFMLISIRIWIGFNIVNWGKGAKTQIQTNQPIKYFNQLENFRFVIMKIIRFEYRSKMWRELDSIPLNYHNNAERYNENIHMLNRTPFHSTFSICSIFYIIILYVVISTCSFERLQRLFFSLQNAKVSFILLAMMFCHYYQWVFAVHLHGSQHSIHL